MVPAQRPVLVFRSARPGQSFEDWLFSRLAMPQRQVATAAIRVFTGHWSGALHEATIGRRHGPSLFELRLRFEAPAHRRRASRRARQLQRAPAGLVSVFFHEDRNGVIVLSGAFVTEEQRETFPGTPGLGAARWRLRELRAISAKGGVPCGRLDFHTFKGIRHQPPHTPRHRSTSAAPPGAAAELIEFDHVYDEVRFEAESRGPDAIAHLRLAEDRLRLAYAVLRARCRHGLTQQRLAAATGVPQGKLSLIEAGVANPTLATISALARALEIELTVGRPDVP